MKIKIAHISNLSDARFFSAFGVDYFGFSLDSLSPDAVTINEVKDITQWLYEPTLVGEFGIHQNQAEIAYLTQQLSLHEIQIPFAHPDKDLLDFSKFIQIDYTEVHKANRTADYFILSLNNKQLADKDVLDFIQQQKVFLEAPVEPEMLNACLTIFRPYGIQIGCQKETGISNLNTDYYAEVLEIIEQHTT